MIAIDIKVNGLSGVLKRFDKISSKIKSRKESALNAIGKRDVQSARQRAPYKTGTLEQSIRYRASGDQVKIYVPVGGPAGQYARYMEEGNYNPGPGTKSKGPIAGRMYVNRACLKNMDDTAKRVKRIVVGL